MDGLRDSVEPLLSGKISSESRDALYASLMLYVFRGCKQSDVRSVVNKFGIEFDFLSWRKSIHHNGQLMKNCKVWAYNSFCHRAALPASFAHISQKDRNTLTTCLNHRPVASHLSSLVEYGATPLDLDEFDEKICESVYSRDVTAYLRTLVRTKLGFLVRSHATPVDDFVDELRTGALFALLRSYPRFEDVGHMRAICKSQAHNNAINIIYTNTTASRQRLTMNDDGTYSSLMVPLAEFGADQVVTSLGSEVISESYLVTGLDGNSQSRWEQSFALSEVAKSHNLSERQRTFLGIMMGQPHAEFSKFLGQDNTVAVEEMLYSAYMRRACKYMKVSYERAQEFLSSLKKVL
jgi:hypothetical protein